MNMLIEILATITDIIVLLWFIPRFVGVFLRHKPISMMWPMACLLFQIVADQFVPVFDLLYMFMCFLFALCFALSLKKDVPLWCLFSSLLFVIIPMLSNSLIYSVCSVLFKNTEVLLEGTILHLRIIYICVGKIVQFAFYRLLLLIFRKDRILDLKNGVLSVLFTIITAIALGALMDIIILCDIPEIDTMILILALILILLNFILYLMIHQVQSLMQSKYNLTLMQERMASEKSRIDDATVVWNNIRKVKHDLKNHFTVIQGKLNEEDIQFCKGYLSELYQTVETMGDIIQSGNSVIDYLINSKLSGLEGIQVLVSGYVGNYNDIEDVDLASILGNILDNAIEAQKYVKEEKRIELYFLQKNVNRIILCKNTIASSVLKNNVQLRSTKSSSELHGLGYQIVESKVNKYNGIIDYFEDEDMFGVQIMLPESKPCT